MITPSAKKPNWIKRLGILGAGAFSTVCFLCICFVAILSNVDTPDNPESANERTSLANTNASSAPTSTRRPTRTATSEPTATEAPIPTPEQVTYTVQGGDTLGKIARDYGTTVEAIVAANGIEDPNRLRVGTVLVIPDATTDTGDAFAALPPTWTPVGSVAAPTEEPVPPTETPVPDTAAAVVELPPTWTPIPPTPTQPLPPTWTLVPPTEVPIVPTDTPLPEATVTEVPVIPTDTPVPPPSPTEPPAAPGQVVISYIYYDGQEYRSEGDEYAEVKNIGGSSVNLLGWRLNAGDNGQDFYFGNVELGPGQVCRIFTNRSDGSACNFTYGRGSAIWDNDGECGFLFDANGAQVSDYCY